MTSLDEKVRNVTNRTDCPIHELYLPKTNEFVTNSRGQKLHVRSFLPAGEPKSLLFSLHGYSAHNNAPWLAVIAEKCIEENVGLITFDFHGHGHSEGFPVDIINFHDLVDDCLTVVFESYSPAVDEQTVEGDVNSNQAVPTEQTTIISSNQPSYLLRRGFKCPFFISGMSLGGVTALATSIELQDIQMNSCAHKYDHISTSISTKDQQRIASLFLGGLYLCPAISLVLPNCLIIALMKYFVVPCFPRAPTPKIGPDLDPALVFYPEFLEFAAKDNIASDPPGMTHAPLIRFRTGLSVLSMTEYVQHRIQEINFPFIVFHDPEDKICTIEGTQRLMNESLTSVENKEFVSIANGLHGLIPNCTELVLTQMLRWMDKRVSIFSDLLAGTVDVKVSDNVV